jgi:hypothetical protein
MMPHFMSELAADCLFLADVFGLAREQSGQGEQGYQAWSNRGNAAAGHGARLVTSPAPSADRKIVISSSQSEI